MSVTKIPVMEIEMDYSHFQHLIQTSSAGFASDVTPHPVTVTFTDATSSPVVFPLSEVIDLSTSASEQCPTVSGEKTPGPYGEVPGFLLDVTRGCPSGLCAQISGNSHNQSGSAAARACLDKRLKTVSADTSNHQDIRFLSKHKPPQDGQEDVIQPQIQPWINTDRSNTFKVSSPFVPFVFNPAANIFSQLPLMAEQKHQTLNTPKITPFKTDSKMFGDTAHLNDSSSSGEQHSNAENAVAKPAAASGCQERDNSPQPVMAAETTPDCSEESGRGDDPCHTWCRKERHNLMERERRRRIRFYCDELNTLVPLCHAKSDKVTTLQWTTAYLRYIHRTHGDTVRKEFAKMVSQGNESIPELRSSSLHKEISATQQ